jgi:lipopolysaccharide export system protein LptA
LRKRAHASVGRLLCRLCLPDTLFLGSLSPLAADPISFSADRVESNLAKGKERTVLIGRAKVVTGAITISADKIELFGKDFSYLDCTGSVSVADTERQIRLKSPRLYYDRVRKLTRAQGPSTLEDDKNKLVLKAEWIEHDGESELLIAQVAVRILKEKLVCRAEYAVYRRNEKALELTGAPSAYKEGDEYRASRILVDTETEEIRLEGEVSGKVAERKKADAVSPAPDLPAASTNAAPVPPAAAPAADSAPTAIAPPSQAVPARPPKGAQDEQ